MLAPLPLLPPMSAGCPQLRFWRYRYRSGTQRALVTQWLLPCSYFQDSAGFGVTKASDWSVGRKYLHMLCVALSSGSPASTVTAAALSAPGGSEPQRAPPRVRKRAVVKVEGLQAVVLLQLS